MGSWNETCMVSHLPIVSGERIRFILFTQNPFRFEKVGGWPVKDGEQVPRLYKGSSGVYIGDLWQPICYPIRGKYNDYGSIEDIPEKTEQDKSELAQFVNVIKEHAVPLEVGENTCHDVGTKDFSLGAILESLQEGRIFFKCHGWPHAVGYAMVKESVWQSLLKIDLTKGDNYFDFDKEGYSVEILKAKITKMVDALNSIKNPEKPTVEELMAMYRAKDSARTYRSVAFEYEGGFKHSAPIKDNPNSNLIQIAAEFDYFYSMLSMLRINFAPTCGSGSQGHEHKLWKKALKAWVNIIEKEDKAWAKEFG